MNSPTRTAGHRAEAAAAALIAVAEQAILSFLVIILILISFSFGTTLHSKKILCKRAFDVKVKMPS
jgi:hypothetical protein